MADHGVREDELTLAYMILLAFGAGAAIFMACEPGNWHSMPIWRRCQTMDNSEIDYAYMVMSTVPVVIMHALPCMFMAIAAYMWMFSRGKYFTLPLCISGAIAWVGTAVTYHFARGFLAECVRTALLSEGNRVCLQNMAERVNFWHPALAPLFIMDTAFFILFIVNVAIHAHKTGAKFSIP